MLTLREEECCNIIRFESGNCISIDSNDTHALLSRSNNYGMHVSMYSCGCAYMHTCQERKFSSFLESATEKGLEKLIGNAVN